MRRRRTKDEVVDRRGLTTVDKNNIRLAQDIVALDIITINGFPTQRSDHELLTKHFPKLFPRPVNVCTSEPLSTPVWFNVDYCTTLVTDTKPAVIKDVSQFIHIL
jgi:hypothetical protein